jgi:ubiquinone/menaquinone biosynthesis C-methylase UbiE
MDTDQQRVPDRSAAAGPSPATKWERAYQAFETPEQELAKFLARLREIGADRWDRRWRVLEVCSGRGTGLRAWSALGFHDVIGVDYSYALIAGHSGPGRCVLGDARAIPLASRSRDIVVVQGGLHHLFTLGDVERALAEMRRVADPAGRIIIVEPWLTPFLRLVHAVCERPLARQFWPKLDALATMIEEERETYERWLSAPRDYLAAITKQVTPQLLRRRWGKLIIVGTPIGPGLPATVWTGSAPPDHHPSSSRNQTRHP